MAPYIPVISSHMNYFTVRIRYSYDINVQQAAGYHAYPSFKIVFLHHFTRMLTKHTDLSNELKTRFFTPDHLYGQGIQ